MAQRAPAATPDCPAEYRRQSAVELQVERCLAFTPQGTTRRKAETTPSPRKPSTTNVDECPPWPARARPKLVIAAVMKSRGVIFLHRRPPRSSQVGRLESTPHRLDRQGSHSARRRAISAEVVSERVHQSLRVLRFPLPYVPPLQDDVRAPHRPHRLRPSPANDASSPHRPHRPPRRAAMTPAAHNVTPNHRQRRPQHRLRMHHIAPTSRHIVPPLPRRRPPRHSARSRAMTIDEGCRKWKGRPGSGRPTSFVARRRGAALAQLVHARCHVTMTRRRAQTKASAARPRPPIPHDAMAKPRDGKTTRRRNHAMAKPRRDVTAHAWRNNASALTVYTYNKCCICSTMRRGDASCQVLPHPQFPVAAALSRLPCAEYSQVYLWVLVRTRALASTRKLADTWPRRHLGRTDLIPHCPQSEAPSNAGPARCLALAAVADLQYLAPISSTSRRRAPMRQAQGPHRTLAKLDNSPARSKQGEILTVLEAEAGSPEIIRRLENELGVYKRAYADLDAERFETLKRDTDKQKEDLENQLKVNVEPKLPSTHLCVLIWHARRASAPSRAAAVKQPIERWRKQEGRLTAVLEDLKHIADESSTKAASLTTPLARVDPSSLLAAAVNEAPSRHQGLSPSCQATAIRAVIELARSCRHRRT
ncbi:hypothetical protein BJ912DRAFT_1079967 [Pholiota molesta]|nr:hypothetical protein BJ912DRAFT_1079967 [Pholiota molesta]